MSHTHTARIVFQSALAASVLVFLAIVSILGVPITTDKASHIGYFLLSANSSGIGIYQPGKYRYFLISPYNDYSVGQNGQITPLLQTGADDGNPTPDMFSALGDRLERIGLYFGLANITKTFPREAIVYATVQKGNTVRITRTISNTTNLLPSESIALTLTYSRDDIVYDSAGMDYTENSDADLVLLDEAYGIKLTRSDILKRKDVIASGAVRIINPHIPGAIEVVAHEGQSLSVNKDAKQIEIEEAPSYVSGAITDYFDVNILSSPKEIRI